MLDRPDSLAARAQGQGGGAAPGNAASIAISTMILCRGVLIS